MWDVGTTFGDLNTVGVWTRLKPETVMTDWLKAFSTHETTNVGVSVEVIIRILKTLLTPHRKKWFNGFI